MNLGRDNSKENFCNLRRSFMNHLNTSHNEKQLNGIDLLYAFSDWYSFDADAILSCRNLYSIKA